MNCIGASDSSGRGPALPIWKRLLDVAWCLMALPLFGVCTFWVACIFGSLSPRVLFFRQERVGYLGRRFSIYKFRTMQLGADTEAHRAHFSGLIRANVPMQKMDARGDTRLVRGGWLLRASGLDELPQIFNVLRGEMSVVGPRPCLPYEYEQYTPEQRRRFAAVPGLTGLWQVSGKNKTTFEEMISLDVKYAHTRSLWLDLKIIVITPIALWVQIAETRRVRRAGNRVHAATASRTVTQS